MIPPFRWFGIALASSMTALGFGCDSDARPPGTPSFAGADSSAGGDASGGRGGALQPGAGGQPGGAAGNNEGAVSGHAEAMGGRDQSNSGGMSAGGMSAGSTSVGGTSAAGSGGTTTVATWLATDYVSRKWARWPIPNPPSLSLPHPMLYEDGATISDRVTGLVWQKITNSATTTWQAALDYCTGLGPGWSLPTRIELTSIIDNTQTGAKSDARFQYGNKAGWTWTATPWVVNSRKVVSPPLSWFINTLTGDSNNSLSQVAASGYARCVQVPKTQTLPAQHYRVQSGEVLDTYTGLTWQQDHSGASPSLTQSDALAYCASLGLDGQRFRLPSLNELASLVDDVPSGDVSPAVDHAAFPNTSKDQWYWSASGYGSSTTDKWLLNFADGFTSHKATSTLGIARCVR